MNHLNTRARPGACRQIQCERKIAKSAKEDAKKKQKPAIILYSSRAPSRSSRFRVRIFEFHQRPIAQRYLGAQTSATTRSDREAATASVLVTNSGN
jgi:hypothetical protein